MKKFTDQDIKNEGLRILLKLHEYCINHNIRYSLFYGSLLGAIRHDGYIPWDDDIDIAMPRDDYERFVKDFNDDNFGVMTCDNNKYYYLPYAKMYSKNTIKIEDIKTNKHLEIGFNLDIFPLDLFSNEDNFHEAKRKEEHLLKRWYLSFLPSKIKNIKTFLIYACCFPIWIFRTYNSLSKKINSFFVNFDKNNKKKEFYVGNETNGNKTNLIFNLNIFDNLILHKFEGYDFYITDQYEHVLRQRYGDYMGLPPKKERKSHHNFEAFFK